MHDKTHLCTHATNPLFNTRLLNLDEVTTKKTISSIYGETFWCIRFMDVIVYKFLVIWGCDILLS